MRAGLADELLAEIRAHGPPGQMGRVFPGMQLALWITSTRAAGFGGEVQFHSVGIARREKVFSTAYVSEDKP